MDEVIRLFKENYSQRQIALRLGISNASVSRMISRLGLKRRNLNQRVSDQELINNRNFSSLELSRKFGISSQAIQERLIRLGINKSLESRIISSADRVRKYRPDFSCFQMLDRVGCYWLGFFYADGSVYVQNKRPNMVSIALQKRDKQILLQLANDLRLPETIVREQKTSFRLALSNIHFAKLLCDLGMKPGKQYKRRIPPLEYKADFVRGFLDGDGSIIIRKNKFLSIRFAITYEQFGNDLNKLISRELGFGINGPYKTKGIWILCASHKKAEKLANWLWSNPLRKLERKYLIYKRWFGSLV